MSEIVKRKNWEKLVSPRREKMGGDGRLNPAELFPKSVSMNWPTVTFVDNGGELIVKRKAERLCCY